MQAGVCGTWVGSPLPCFAHSSDTDLPRMVTQPSCQPMSAIPLLTRRPSSLPFGHSTWSVVNRTSLCSFDGPESKNCPWLTMAWISITSASRDSPDPYAPRGSLERITVVPSSITLWGGWMSRMPGPVRSQLDGSTRLRVKPGPQVSQKASGALAMAAA